MPDWMLFVLGILIGLLFIGGGLWWAFAGEFKPSRLPKVIEQGDNWSDGPVPDRGASHHVGGDFGGHGGV